jgi:hypothetical protein
MLCVRYRLALRMDMNESRSSGSSGDVWFKVSPVYSHRSLNPSLRSSLRHSNPHSLDTCECLSARSLSYAYF